MALPIFSIRLKETAHDNDSIHLLVHRVVCVRITFEKTARVVGRTIYVKFTQLNITLLEVINLVAHARRTHSYRVLALNHNQYNNQALLIRALRFTEGIHLLSTPRVKIRSWRLTNSAVIIMAD